MVSLDKGSQLLHSGLLLHTSMVATCRNMRHGFGRIVQKPLLRRRGVSSSRFSGTVIQAVWGVQIVSEETVTDHRTKVVKRHRTLK
eukprot:scaffold486713_cov19-Prasinocladus_malaysianus.AAC.1